MRYITLPCCLLALVAGIAGAAQTDPPAKPTRKGDTLIVKGCLRGTALEAAETNAADATALLAGGLTFRVTGKRALLKELREKHNGKLVEVKGVLKSELPMAEGQSLSLGRMRVTIGAASPNAGRPEAESRRALPVLEVTGFEGGDTSCLR